jgi:hypothetical protein
MAGQVPGPGPDKGNFESASLLNYCKDNEICEFMARLEIERGSDATVGSNPKSVLGL